MQAELEYCVVPGHVTLRASHVEVPGKRKRMSWV
jgi:hypothetical protein